jgi:adenylosuccinate synthase
LVKHGHRLNRLSSLYVTGLDVLDNLDKIKICKKYIKGEDTIEGVLPTVIDDLGKLKPEMKIMDGWK